MEINTQNYLMQSQASFKGSVDRSVINKIRQLERDTIKRQVNHANWKGTEVDSQVIEKIKARFNSIIEALNEKAKMLFEDSVIMAEKDSGQIYVKNKKLNHSSHMLKRNRFLIIEDNFSNFNKMMREKIASKDPVAIVENDLYKGIYNNDPNYHIKFGEPKTIDELECLVKELFNPKDLNQAMLNQVKTNVIDSLRRTSKITNKIKQEVMKILSVEKELEPTLRQNSEFTDFWSKVKKQIQLNAKKSELIERNSKHLE